VIQIAPQFRILVAIEAIDGRKYAPSINMRSRGLPTRRAGHFERPWTAHNGRYCFGRSMASSLSGGRKRPRRKAGGTKDAMASNFSVGSALK
jgi:hypothetical protein